MEIAQEMTSRSPRRGLDLRAVVLVGGRDFGRCPLASVVPTALWPLADRPVLSHLLDHLAQAGLERAAVCCGKEDAAAVAAVCREAPLRVTPVVEELTAGTAGCLRDAVAGDPGDLILVLSASMLAPPSLAELVEAHQAGAADLTVVFNPGAGPDALGPSAEIYVCRPEVLSHIPRGGYSDIKEGLIPAMLRAGGTIRPAVLDRPVGNFHNRVGYLQTLEVLRHAGEGPGLRPLPGGILNEASSGGSIHPTARLCGPVLLGAGARVEEGAVVIGPAVLGRDVVVGAASVVVRSALWTGARVGDRCEIRESIVDCQTQVPEGTEVIEQSLSPRLARARRNRPWLRGGRRGVESANAIKPVAAPRRVPGTSRSWRSVSYALGSVVLLAVLLRSYEPTVRELIGEWRRSDEYSSGLLVPFLTLYVAWLRRADLLSIPVRPALFLGTLLFAGAQAVRAVGLNFFIFAERFSLILSLAAVVLLVLGRKYLAQVATLLLFLCLMLPWPHRVQEMITLPLQRWSTNSAVFCLELVGYEVRQDGNVIHIGNASVAVAEACNGLRMITAFFVISGLVVLLVNRTWWEKCLILASSLPIAFLCNTLRLAATALCFTVIKGEVWEQRFHDWGGYAMMPLALALVVGELSLLTKLTIPPTPLEPAIISRRQTPPLPDLSNGRTGV